MQAELEKCRENETTWRQRLEHRDGQLGLMRNELEAEQKTIASLELEVKELQSKLDKDDTSFRNEVSDNSESQRMKSNNSIHVVYALFQTGDQVAFAAHYLPGTVE